MYVITVTLLMLILPAISVAAEMLWQPGATELTPLIGKWFTFWAVGVRLFAAGVMQTLRPQFTARSIFEIGDPAALAIVREVGYGNLAMGTLGLLSLAMPAWLVPAALAGALYLGLAGIGHAVRKARNFKEQFAMVSDIGLAVLLLAFVGWSLV